MRITKSQLRRIIKEVISENQGEWRSPLNTVRDALWDFYMENYAALATGELSLEQLRTNQERIAAEHGWSDYEEYLVASDKEISSTEDKMMQSAQLALSDAMSEM